MTALQQCTWVWNLSVLPHDTFFPLQVLTLTHSENHDGDTAVNQWICYHESVSVVNLLLLVLRNKTLWGDISFHCTPFVDLPSLCPLRMCEESFWSKISAVFSKLEVGSTVIVPLLLLLLCNYVSNRTLATKHGKTPWLQDVGQTHRGHQSLSV
jgi:hypothetical protein